jgi:hypothetical protein
MREMNCNYLSYLLRVWKDSIDGEWHATIQDVISGESYHFATLYELYVNLRELTSERGNNQLEQLVTPARIELSVKGE